MEELGGVGGAFHQPGLAREGIGQDYTASRVPGEAKKWGVAKPVNRTQRQEWCVGQNGILHTKDVAQNAILRYDDVCTHCAFTQNLLAVEWDCSLRFAADTRFDFILRLSSVVLL